MRVDMLSTYADHFGQNFPIYEFEGTWEQAQKAIQKALNTDTPYVATNSNGLEVY